MRSEPNNLAIQDPPPREPFTAVVDVDSVTVTCPCGAVITGEGDPIVQFKANHSPHTNGRTLETIKQPEIFNPEAIKALLIDQGINIAIRLKVGEACQWLRQGAAGRALEALEHIQNLYEQQDRL